MHGMGELEETVMGVLWQAQSPLTVRDVLSEINRSRALAYTTVMTVMHNLHFARSATDHESTILRRALDEPKSQ